jgi:sulfatase maturation enzyme AslB (radical SAM superfamily)
MTCNATLLNEDYVKFLEQNGMFRIHVSFDGARKDTFERLRLGADYERVLHNCSLIGKSKIQLFMNVLLSCNEVIEQLPEYVQLARKVGATGVHFMKYQAESLDHWGPPSYELFKGSMKAFEKEAKKVGLMYVSTCAEEPTYTGCDDAFACPYVLLNGDVYGCSYIAALRRSEVYQEKVFSVPYENYKMGNLHENWMKDIWFGKEFTELRKLLRDTKVPFGTRMPPQELLRVKSSPPPTRFAHCIGCLCRWGESGI